jgi:hypothetical protein
VTARVLAPLAAIVLTVVAMSPATRVSWSADDPYVLAHLRSSDPRVRLFAYNVDRPSPEAGAWWDGVRYQRRFIRVLPCAIMAAEVGLFGQRPHALHVVSLLMHLAIVGLVWTLARRWLGDPVKAALVAGLFGVHPVAMEPVGWFALQPILVGGILCLVAAEAWVRYRLGTGQAWLWGALAATACALLSYEATVLLPVVLVAGDILLMRGRFDGRARWRPRLALLSLLAPYLLWSVLIRTGVPALETSYRPTLQMMWTAARIDFANYVFKALGLMNPKTPAGYWLYNAVGEPFALALLAAIVAPVLWWSRRRPLACLGIIAFLAFLAPPWLIRATVGALNIPSLRQVYLPLLGLCAVVTAALAHARPRTACAIVVPVILAFVVLGQVPRRGVGTGGVAVASGPVRKALENVDPRRPVILVGSFVAPKRPGCGYELGLDWPGRTELRLVPSARSGAVPRLVRTGERTFTASAPDGFALPMAPEPLRMQAQPPRFNPGGFRILLEPPVLVREGSQMVDGGRVEVVARDAQSIRTLLFTLDRSLDDYVFLGAEGCKDVRLAVLEGMPAI